MQQATAAVSALMELLSGWGETHAKYFLRYTYDRVSGERSHHAEKQSAGYNLTGRVSSDLDEKVI